MISLVNINYIKFINNQEKFTTRSNKLKVHRANSQVISPYQKKVENLYEIKLVSKGKIVNRKGHTSFLVFCFWNFKLVPINSASNSALGTLIYGLKCF